MIELVERALCNGKTLAFQARDAGSIPAARSTLLAAGPRPSVERRAMSPAAVSRLSFVLLTVLTLYASLVGAG